jgi:S1-C subfamily serine protease
MNFNFGRESVGRSFLIAGFIASLTMRAAVANADALDAGGASVTASSNADAVANSVVKIFSTVRQPNPYTPWTKQAPTEITGSGVVIDGRRILTCAHVVLYASQVQIQADQSADKVSATVESIAPDIDLAVLKLDDESFFDSHTPLSRTTNAPGTGYPVIVYGYPLGGTSLSITRGIISRIEFASYNFPANGLRIQIDAAINPGNSGGPAVVNNKMIGIAFSRLTGGTQNIGYIIPCEEIDFFLKATADGHYDGKPTMMDSLQTLENPALRSFLKIDKSVDGMVVREPYDSDPAYPLKKWDVITKIGDMAVDDQGMIRLNDDLRVYFKYHIQKIAKDGKVPLTIMRVGKEIQIELPVPSKPAIVIPFLNGTYPPYFIYGPIVFSEATQEFIQGFASQTTGFYLLSLLGIEGSPLVKRMGDKPAFDGERLVVISSPFFPHDLSKGYVNPVGDIVKTVNGIPIRNLAHLVEVLRDSKDEFITIEVESRVAETLVFPRAKILSATDDILTDNGIRSQGSPDTMAVWNDKSSDRMASPKTTGN